MKEYEFEIERGRVHVRCGDRSDGSFALDEPPAALEDRRLRLLGADRRWIGLRQVHGNEVFEPDAEPAIASDPAARAATYDPSPPHADAAITFSDDLGVSVLTADCAPVVLVGSTGVAVVHAGWKGAIAGVIEAAAERLRAGGADPVASVLGPCIQPGAYEFGASDLAPIIESFGSEIVGRTATGTDALDLTRVVQICCERAGWLIPDRPDCTSGSGYFSHRTRVDLGRQATVAWIESETL